MPKNELLRRIDAPRPRGGNGRVVITVPGGGGGGLPAGWEDAIELIDQRLHVLTGLYAGVADGAHVGIFEDDPNEPDKGWFEATDQSNVPFWVAGVRTTTPGDILWRLGYEGQPGIYIENGQVRVDPDTLSRPVADALCDYVIRVEGGECQAISGATNEVTFTGTDHAAVIQQAIDAAGTGGTLAFRPGEYWLSQPMKPQARQSWWLPFGAVFHPSGDNRILEAEGVDWFHQYGTLHIEDTARNTSSAEAIYLDAVAACYFQHILIWDYYKGMTFSGVTGRSFENVFDNIYMAVVRHQGLVILAEVGDNYFNNVFIKGPSTTEWATGQGLVLGLYPSQGTIFGGIMFNRVEVLDCYVNVDLQGLYEVWFDQLLSDNAFWAALYIGDQVQRLFVGTVWAAGSGDGIWIQGSTSKPANRIMIDKAFCWINAQYGVHMNGQVEDVHIGELFLLENQVCQFAVRRGEVRNVTIDKMTIQDTPSDGLAMDVGGADENVVVHELNIDAGETMGLDHLRQVDGAVGALRFRNRGKATIPAGQTSVTVAHGLEWRPTLVHLTPYHQETAQAYISDRNASTFTISVPAAVTADREIAWEAVSGRELGTELLQNPEVDAGSTEPDNWHASGSGTEWATSTYRTAPRSLRLHPATGLASWHSDPFTVTAGRRYRLRAYLKGLTHNFTFLNIRWYSNPDGTGLIGEDGIALPAYMVPTDWFARVQGEFTAPDGAQSADVILKNTADGSTDLYGDDFYFNESGQPNKLQNPSVETGGTAPDNWTPGGVNATWESQGHTGSKSLRIRPTEADSEWAADYVTIMPGATYLAGGWFKGTASGNASITVRWYSDAEGRNLIGETSKVLAGQYADWTQWEESFQAPANAQSAIFLFRAAGITALDVYADSFSVKEVM